ncbi:MAG: dipeptidase [Gemmataceae bacterium]
MSTIRCICWQVLFGLVILLSCHLPAGEKGLPMERGAVKLSEEASRIHQEGFVFYGHNDVPWRLRELDDLSFRVIDLRKHQKEMHTDIPRLRKGNVGAQFWSAYVPSSTAKKGTSVRDTLEQIDVIHRMVQTYPDVFEMAQTAADVERIRQKGKIASLIGIEGGHSIDNSLAVLRMYHRLGVKYMTLTHTDNVDWADSATDKPKNKGLSPFGEQVVREMNRLGMLVDISHVSPATMHHVLNVTRAPVIASHSSAYALADHPRNVPDDVLKRVKENGGVVMVNFYSGFITPEGARIMRDGMSHYRELSAQYSDKKELKAAWQAYRKERPFPRGSVHHVVDHIEHIIKIAGVDHVGIGSDYDGVDSLPRQLEDVSTYPLITQVLLDRGYKKKDIHKILGENVLRVMRKAEKVAREWQE